MSSDAPAIFARHRARLFASVERRVRPPIDPADIVQETWVRAMPAIEAGRVDNVSGFLFGIARNLAAEAMRQQQRWSQWLIHDPEAERIADDAPSAETHVVGRDELQRLYAAAQTLPPRCGAIFAMRHIEMLEKQEIADRLGIGAKQVDKQLAHALMLCSRFLAEERA
jgi:RNA polymerase sigma-70 factor (ECF subfamily)